MEDPTFFKTPLSFSKWLTKNHTKKEVLWVGYFKKHTGIPSITWEESVTEALCYGWIDGLRRSINQESYKIRFTPRRKNSIWSPKNLKTIEKLIRERRIKDPGMAIYEQRKTNHSVLYDNMSKDWPLQKSYVKELKSNPIAWKHYNSLSPSVKKQADRWIMTAKKEETRQRRFKVLLQSCQNNVLVPSLVWTKK